MPDTIFITGGARGIGRAIAEECLGLGYDVAFSYREGSEVEAALDVVEGARARFPEQRCASFALDVRDSSAVDRVAERVMEELGSVFGVVCNAGINAVRVTPNVPDEEWNDVLRTNLYGAFYTARAFLEHLLVQRRGRIVMLSSLNHGGSAGGAAYAASKAALLGLAGSIAKEYGARGITCNSVTPGLIDSDMTREHLTPELEAFWSRYCPVGRQGRREEVAHAVGFLLSPRASLINGVVLPITGGLDWFP